MNNLKLRKLITISAFLGFLLVGSGVVGKAYAYPTVESVNGQAFSSNATTHNVTMPATVDSGDLLIVLISQDGTATITNPTGWTVLSTQTVSSTMRAAVHYKFASGSEDGTNVNFQTSSSEQMAVQVYRISGANSIEITSATGSSSGPDSPSLSPSWGSDETLWISGFAANNGSRTVSSYPSSFTNGAYQQAGTDTNGGLVGSARRNQTTSSQNPGAFTLSNTAPWAAWTIGVEPIAPTPTNTPTPTPTPTPANTAPSSAGTISYTPNPVGSDNQYTVTFTPTDDYSTGANQINYIISDASTTGSELTEGGTSLASGENLPNEGKDKAFDNDSNTKWLVFTSTGTLGYDFSGSSTNVVNKYRLTSANDEPTRDPKNWQFQGSNNGTDWTTLDTRTGETFGSRFETKEYTFSNTTPYQMYRLNITLNNGWNGIIQLAELSMYNDGAILTSGTSTSGQQKTTSTVTDSTLTDGATRYVILCDQSSACASFSFTVAKGTPPTVSTLSSSNLTPFAATLNAQANPIGVATTGYFRYWTSDPGSCTDSGGTRAPSSSGTSLGSGNSPVGYSQNITGLTPGTTYYYCAIADNGSKGYGTISNFTAPGGGQCSSVPQSGNYAISSSCVFADSTNDGVDSGTGTTNNALMTINATRTLTVGPGQTISYGSINKSGASIVKFGGGVLMKAPVWIPDDDEDDYPNAASVANQVVSFTRPAGYMRRAVANGLAADCNSSDADVFVNVANTATDADQDGYYTGGAGTNCVGSSTTLSGRTYYKNAAGSYGYVTSASAIGSTDCLDSDAAKWQNLTGYADTDGDTYGAGGSQQVCSGSSVASPYVANNTDCASSDATKWQNLTGYADADGDGVFGTSSSQVCSGNSLPSGYQGSAGTDCKDTGTSASQVWVVKTCYIDNDGDTYTNGSKTCTNHATCTSATRASTGSSNDVTTYTAGRLLNSASGTADCADSSSNVRPNQTSYFTSQTPNGDYDYNCDGSDSKQAGFNSCQEVTSLSKSQDAIPDCVNTTQTAARNFGTPACGAASSSGSGNYPDYPGTWNGFSSLNCSGSSYTQNSYPYGSCSNGSAQPCR